MNSPTAPGAPRWTERHPQPATLGVVMIVKDEAENLPEVFASLRDVADEVVVVDTGSRDGTREVCRAWGVTLVHDAWRDDFSRARNRSIQAATATHLLWIDADDRLPERTQRELIRLRDEVLPHRNDIAYLMEVRNRDQHGAVGEIFLQTRLFPRRRGVRFENPIHEQITGSLAALGISQVVTDLVIDHTGYASLEVVAGKARRNEATLRQAVRRNPGDIHHLVHLALTLLALGRRAESEELLSRAIELTTTGGGRERLLAELHAVRASLRMGLARQVPAIYDLESAAALRPGWGVPHVLLAEVRLLDEDLEGAWHAIERARTGDFSPGVIGFPLLRIRSKQHFFAGYILLRRGEDVEGAVGELRRALEVDPGNLDARLELGHTLLEREEYEAARSVLEPAGDDEAAIPRFVEVSAAIGLARAMTGDEAGAGACLTPLLDVLAAELDGMADVSSMELAEAMLKAGQSRAARHMITLFQKTVRPAA